MKYIVTNSNYSAAPAALDSTLSRFSRRRTENVRRHNRRELRHIAAPAALQNNSNNQHAAPAALHNSSSIHKAAPAAHQTNSVDQHAASAALSNEICYDLNTPSHVRYSSPIPFPNVVRYVVIQTAAVQAIAILHPEQPFETLNTAPALLAINETTQLDFDPALQIPNADHRSLHIMDIIQARAYFTVTINGEQLPIQRLGSDFQLADHIKGNNVRAATTLAAGDVTQRLITTLSTVSLVHHCTLNRTRKGQVRRTLQYVGRYAETPAKADENKLVDLPCNIQQGDFVVAHHLQLIPGMHVSGTCYLPAEFPQQKGFQVLGDNAADTVLHSIQYLKQSLPCLFPDPFTSRQVHPQDRKRTIRIYEDLLLAVTSHIQHRTLTALFATAYTGTSYELHDRNLTLHVPAPEDPKQLTRRLRFWTKNTIMYITSFPLTRPEEDFPITFQHEGTAVEVKGTITDVLIEEDGQMHVTIGFEEKESRELHQAEPCMRTGCKTIFVQPDPSHTGLEFRQRQLRYRALSGALPPNAHPNKRTILHSLMGINRPFPPQQPSEDLLAKKLTPEQAMVIRTLNCGAPILFQQAPAGTGKTYVIAAYARELLNRWTDQDTNVLILSATTNNAVINMATTLLRMMPDLELTQMIFLQSLAAEKLYNVVRDISEDNWKEHRLPELLRAMRDSQTIPEEVLRFVHKYIDVRLPHEGKRADDRRALRIIMQSSYPRIIVGTTAMIQNHYNMLRELGTHLAFDEAGLIPDADLTTLLAGFSRLHQVFLTGDKQQLPAYHAYIPDDLLQYGFEGTLETLHRRRSVTCMSLTHSYRAHPILTECLSYASYNNQLKAMLNAEDRSLLTASALHLPVQSVPIVLLDIPGYTTTLGVSKINSLQENAALGLHAFLCEHVPAARIALLAFYSGTKNVLQSELARTCSEICTVDGFQGKEADIVILLTTRTEEPVTSTEDYSFIADPQRVTVALSRAKHGLFVLGDMQLLLQYDVWRRYINKATEYTPICGGDYILNMAEESSPEQAQRSILPTRHFDQNNRWSNM